MYVFNGTGIISLCITRAGDMRNLEFITELNNKAVEKGYRLFVYQTCSEYYDASFGGRAEIAVFELIDYKATDILVIFDEAFSDKSIIDNIIQKADENNVSVISVGAGNPKCTSFVFDYRSGYEQIVRHVVEYHNATDTVFMAGAKGNSFSDERIDIYKSVLIDNNLPFGDDNVYYGDYWSGPIRESIKRITEREKLPEAIICVIDSTAAIVCEELERYGYKIPDDIIVTGFDETSEGLCNTPQITTGSCSMKKAAEAVLTAIDKILAGETVPKVNAIKFDMVIYSSCGCEKNQENQYRRNAEADGRNF